MELELALTPHNATTIAVTCNGAPSHTFEYSTLPSEHEASIVSDPIAYGKNLYQALFSQGTLAQQSLAQAPTRILFIATTDELDAIAWEYLHSPDDFLVLETPFVRGLPTEQRIDSPPLTQPLHIVAVPSNPLSTDVAPLNIDGEWRRIKDIINDVQASMTLERTRPATIERVRSLVAGQRNRVIHFMGHGGQHANGAILCFEKENGSLDLVTAKQFTTRVRGTVFLVTLNACVGATPGPTHFSNLAKTLVQQRTPYALGMRLSIHDDDARTFSRSFYDELARGLAIEEALLQARLTLSSSECPFAIGIPVLYTSLKRAAPGFAHHEGIPTIKEYQPPPMDVFALPRAQGTFQGRIEDLAQIGTHLTGDNRARIVTIHGSGGQGKTALAREVVERFSYAWPGGVWAISLENLPSRRNGQDVPVDFDDHGRDGKIDSIDRDDTRLKQLRDALLDAFPTHQQLEIMVSDGLNENLEAVASEDNLDHTAFELIRWAKSGGRLEQLIIAARKQNSQNSELRRVAGLFGLENDQNLPRSLGPDKTAQKIATSSSVTPTNVALALARFLGIETQSTTDPIEIERLLFARLATKRLLIVLDNAETLVESVEAKDHIAIELAQLLQRLPSNTVSLLVTSRRQLGWSEEKIHELDGLSDEDGAALFRQWAPARQPDIPRSLAEQLSNKLKGHPLGLRLLAGAFNERSVTLSTFIKEYDKQLALVADKYAQQDHRHRTLIACIETSVHALSEELRTLLGGLWIFRAPFLPNVATRIFDPEKSEGNEIDTNRFVEEADDVSPTKERLYALWQRGLLARETITVREGTLLFYYLLPTTRPYVEGHLRQSRQEELLTTRFAAVYAWLVGYVFAELNKGAMASTIVRQCREDFEQAWPYLARLELAHYLLLWGSILYRQGYSAEGEHLLKQALPIMREVGDRDGEAVTLNNLGELYRGIGQLQRALELYEEALLIVREVGDRVGEARVLNNLATVYQGIGQPQQVLELLEQALPIVREMGSRNGEAMVLNNLGELYRGIGQPQRARALYEEALPIMREVSNRDGEARALNNLGLVYQGIGQLQQALELFEDALLIWREVGNRDGDAKTLNNLAAVYQGIGQPQRVLELLEQALPIMREVGNRDGEAMVLNNLAAVYQGIGQPQRVLELYEEVLLIWSEVGNHYGEATTLNNLGLVYQGIGQPQRALELYEEVLLIWSEAGNRYGEAMTLSNLGVVYAEIGQLQQALALYKEALPIMREVGNRAGEAMTLVNLAFLFYQHLDKQQEAITYLEQAIAILQHTGLPQNAAGQTLEHMLNCLQAMRDGTMPTT